jgi:hypothetical protein
MYLKVLDKLTLPTIKKTNYLGYQLPIRLFFTSSFFTDFGLWNLDLRYSFFLIFVGGLVVMPFLPDSLLFRHFLCRSS